jgi:aspartate aminotransferase-like enzyme
VDAVSSIGGTPVLVDAWNIDLCLGGAQKCLSAPPSTCFLSVSDAAWDIIRTVDYQGYDALKPFEPALVMRFFPYTPDWHGIAALYAASSLILQEGLENCFLRHQTVADFCRKGLVQIGLKLYPSPDAIPSPTVTAVYVPEPLTWTELDLRCRRHGLVVGGNIGELEGKVFRLGHMGSQADMALAEQALAVLANAL